MRGYAKIIVTTFIMLVFACASPGRLPLSSLQTQMEDARLDAASVDAQRRCPDEWAAAENMAWRAEQFHKNGQDDSAAAALKFAVDLYHNAARCAAQARDRELMPNPLSPPPPPMRR
jgi:hypothetical protein